MIPNTIPNFIDGKMCNASEGATFIRCSPHSGDKLFDVSRSSSTDLTIAIAAAQKAKKAWGNTNPVVRGDMMRKIALRMKERKDEIAAIVAAETGKALIHALGETKAAIEMGMFVAGEGRRNYGKTTTASMDHRTVMTMRQPLGVAALIIASNTPIANVAWKAFPSMFCGNASIMKPSEDTPGSAWIFADICREVGLPDGVFNVVHGFGQEAGLPLIESEDIDLVSFTGSCNTGKVVNEIASRRLAKVCMELGGKNALVVCEDADVDNAIYWTLESAFSNAGQRCVAASRLIVQDSIYDTFKQKLIDATRSLSLGNTDKDFLGPMINAASASRIIEAVNQAVSEGATLLIGGIKADEKLLRNGNYIVPTILENVDVNASASKTELFGPVTCLHKVADFEEALLLVNNSDYGLSASIHTANLHRAMEFVRHVEAGVVVVNGGTHGSEPHMGFGGVKNSGTGWREAGVEALDVYSEIKYVNIITNPELI